MASSGERLSAEETRDLVRRRLRFDPLRAVSDPTGYDLAREVALRRAERIHEAWMRHLARALPHLRDEHLVRAADAGARRAEMLRSALAVGEEDEVRRALAGAEDAAAPAEDDDTILRDAEALCDRWRAREDVLLEAAVRVPTTEGSAARAVSTLGTPCAAAALLGLLSQPAGAAAPVLGLVAAGFGVRADRRRVRGHLDAWEAGFLEPVRADIESVTERLAAWLTATVRQVERRALSPARRALRLSAPVRGAER